MKTNYFNSKNKNGIIYIIILFIILSPIRMSASTESTNLRRPISQQSPVWFVHIDTWTWPDPQKCIDLIPEDIRPYVVMNISLSVSSFVKDKYPFTIAESWIRTCAENGMWATIQPSSGGPNNFSNTSMDVYEYFYANYPNFLGWNFCEQSWGFSSENILLDDRINMFTDLLKLGDKYGGYLVVSYTLTMASPSCNALAMLKSNSEFAEATKTYKDNFIACEKYTTTRGFYDIESTSLGAYLSGHAGYYGIRFDQSGWPTDHVDPFAEASGGIPIIEHTLLTGQTVMDGPELTWRIAIIKDKPYTTSDGFTAKLWSVHPSFTNINIDIFRKILDGTIRIPSREEVIERTKIAFVNDATTGNDRNRYSTEQSLFTGLYAMDGEWDTNNTWFKKTGRYPTIPAIHKVGDYETGGFDKVVTKKNYATTWSTVQAKVDEFNNLYPEEYKGDIYAGRINNSWAVYNPYMNNTNKAEGVIPFKYNTCDSLYLSFSPYSMGVINETNDKLYFYLNNFCTESVYGEREDIIKVYGCISEPILESTYRGDRNNYSITKSWDNSKGIFTLSVKHNGPIDLTLNCSGKSTGRLTNYPEIKNMIVPEQPPIYTGPRQYEAENFEYKSISGTDQTSLTNYTAMGYVSFGTNSAASIRTTVNVLKDGTYLLKTKYNSSGGDINTVDLYVNDVKIGTPLFTQTSTDEVWATQDQVIKLKSGDNVIMFKANAKASYGINFDNIIILDEVSNTEEYTFENDIVSTTSNNPPALNTTLYGGRAGVVTYTDINNEKSKYFKAYSGGTSLHSGGVVELDLFPSSTNYSIVWKECYTTSGGKKGILLRGTGDNGSCSYETGMKQGYLFIVENLATGNVKLKPYIANPSGISAQRDYISSFTVNPSEPCWFRASATGNTLVFECSKDSINWEGAATTTFVNDLFTSGSTEIVWGLDSNNYSWVMDNISFIILSSTGINSDQISETTIVSTEYYNINGLKVANIENCPNGIYIIKNRMSDGSVKTSKVIRTR